MTPCRRLRARVPSPSSILTCFEWCAKVLKAKTLINHNILLEKAMNMKINEKIHEETALLSTVFSFDSKLACGFYECLSEEWSAST